jgi:hypothetical protein
MEAIPVPGAQFTVKSGKQSQKNRKTAQKAMSTEQSPVVSQYADREFKANVATWAFHFSAGAWSSFLWL